MVALHVCAGPSDFLCRSILALLLPGAAAAGSSVVVVPAGDKAWTAALKADSPLLQVGHGVCGSCGAVIRT